ncbi:putative BAH domain-containing protein [Helianthus anomalus]
MLLRPANSDNPPYIAQVEKLEANHQNYVKVQVRWYYRPEESLGGRRSFHGSKLLQIYSCLCDKSVLVIRGEQKSK